MKRILKMSITTIAAAALFAAVPFAAQGAECFDEETSDPKAGDATAVVGPAVGLRHATADDYDRPDEGDDVFTGDWVRTGEESHLQLKLCDWSTYTFSPDSEAAISEFYNPDGAGRRRAINFVRGGFRYGSGRDTEPGSTEVEVQDSGVTMGVRGTNVILVELDGIVYVLLEGPALDNTGLSPQGLVDFWRGNRDEIVARLKRPGYVVTIGPDGVSRPFRAGPELLRRIYEAFVPVIPDEDGRPLEYTYYPLNNSGQGAQEGGDYQQYAGQEGDNDDATTDERYPEQPHYMGEVDMGDVIDIGDVLPLDALEEYAEAQGAMPDGHVLALAPARLFVDSGAGETLADEGVALVQIHVDWATRTIAPEALASFVKLDFSVADPNDLSLDDFDFMAPGETLEGYVQALLNSAGLPFSSGENGLAVIPSQLFTFIIREGGNDTVTVDVEVDVTTQDNQNNSYRAEALFLDLMLMPGEGELAAFKFDFGDVFTPGELDALTMRAGVTILKGDTDIVFSTLTGPSLLPGIAVGQLEVDFSNRTVGGGTSFLAVTAPDSGAAYLPLDQAVSFDSGLFGLAFYPLSSLSSGPSLLKGQTLVGSINNELGADIAAILDTSEAHLYTEVELDNFVSGAAAAPIAIIAGLEGNSFNDFLGMGIYPSFIGGTLHYDGTDAGRGYPGLAELETAGGLVAGGEFEAAIDINFANRTIGGGNSHVAVSINDTGQNIILNFVEYLGQVSFDDAVSGVGVLGFDGADFNGSNVNSALLLIRDDPQFPGQGEKAELLVNFTDGAGGAGRGDSDLMPLSDGPSPMP